MGAGVSSTLPYKSVKDAKKAGKTQAEIDAWLATNQPAAAASAASTKAANVEVCMCAIVLEDCACVSSQCNADCPSCLRIQ